MASFLDMVTGNPAQPALGDIFGAPGGPAAPSLGQLFGGPGGTAPSLGQLFGAPSEGLAPSLGSLFGGAGTAPFESLGQIFGGTGGGTLPLGSILGGAGAAFSTLGGIFGGPESGPTLQQGMAQIHAAKALAQTTATTATKPAAPTAGSSAPAAAPGSASLNNYAFAQQHTPLAMQAIQSAGANLDPSIPVAIAANETGWGQAAQGGQPWNSYLGVRGQGSAGQTPGGFAAYLQPQDAYDAWVQLVTDPNGRYYPAYQQYQQDQNANAFIQNIANAGYALAGPEAQAWTPQVQGLLPQVQQQWNAPLPPGSVQPLPNAPLPAGATTGTYQAGGLPWNIAFDFNQPYSTPLSQGTAVHRGVDLTIPGAANNGRGTPYQAFVPGVVTNLTEDPDGGHGIIVQSADGLYERYFHNDKVLVTVGQPVGRPGDPPIGIVGGSGTESFPHLHFEVSRGVNGDPPGQLIDPRPYLQAAGVVQ